MIRALFIGSIGVLAETSLLQRDCFNTAFKEAGLDWHWDTDQYRAMLATSGGRKRIEAYAATRDESVDAQAIHARKSALFQEHLQSGVDLRAGVADTLQAARNQDMKIAFVTTTSRANVDQILRATKLPSDVFDVILDASMVGASKPDPQCYLIAMKGLDVIPQNVIVIEDNPDGARAAQAADLTPYVTPGALHDASDFDPAVVFLDHMQIPET